MVRVESAADGNKQTHPFCSLLFVFNLIVGFGALSLPRVFLDAGIVLSSVLLFVLAALSFVTASFVIESMAVANAVVTLQGGGTQYAPCAKDDDAESTVWDSSDPTEFTESDCDTLPMADAEAGESGDLAESDGDPVQFAALFSIRTKTELTQMVRIFQPRLSTPFFGILLAYLIGDLAIYATVVGKTLAAFVDSGSEGVSGDGTLRLIILGFGMFVVPLSCLNFTKTTPLQFISLITRGFALLAMAAVAVRRATTVETVELTEISEGAGLGSSLAIRTVGDTVDTPASDEVGLVSGLIFADFTKIPEFIGVAVYSFMCHHSLPSIVTPMRSKRQVLTLLATDYAVIAALYWLLCGSAVQAFGNLQTTGCRAQAGPPCGIHDIYL